MKYLALLVTVLGVSACCSSPPAPVAAEPTKPPETKPPETMPPVDSEAIAEGGACGGIAPRHCADGLYCNQPDHCGAADQSGTCTKKPEVCTRDFRPVCGCDSKVYPNSCSAAAAGVSVMREGDCPLPN